MIVLKKKRMILMLMLACIPLFAFSFQIADNNSIETVSLPVTNKVVVIDAGHGVPDERGSLLKSEKVAYIR